MTGTARPTDQVALRDAVVGLGAIVAVDALLVAFIYPLLASSAGGETILAWLPVFLAAAIAIPTACLLVYLRRRGIPLGFRPLGKKGWHLLWQVPCAIAFAGVSASIVGSILGIEPKDTPSVVSNGIGIAAVLSLAAYLLMAPFIEEIVFRRIVLTYFDSRMPSALSIIFSSLMFGALHIAPPVIVYATFLGIGCAAVTKWHNSLWAGFILHMSNNVLVQLLAISVL